MGKPEAQERRIEGTRTFVNDALESYNKNTLATMRPEVPDARRIYNLEMADETLRQDFGSLRITLNSRLAIAAAAIVQRIIIRRRPRVLRPLLPLRNGSSPAATIIDAVGEMDACRQESLRSLKEQIVFAA